MAALEWIATENDIVIGLKPHGSIPSSQDIFVETHSSRYSKKPRTIVFYKNQPFHGTITFLGFTGNRSPRARFRCASPYFKKPVTVVMTLSMFSQVLSIPGAIEITNKQGFKFDSAKFTGKWKFKSFGGNIRIIPAE